MLHHASILVLSVLFLWGCGPPFLHTTSATGPATRDPGLVGEWETTDPASAIRTRAVIGLPDEGGPPDAYRVALTVQHEAGFDTTLSLDLTLVGEGPNTFADVFLAKPEREKLVGTYGFLVLPVHQLLKLSRDGDELRLWSLDERRLQREGTPYARERLAIGGGEVTVITAPPEQLRSLIEEYGDDPTAFGKPTVLRRVHR